MVLEEHLAALCPELKIVLDDAESSGNPVVETWRGFGQAARLKKPRPVLTGVTPDVRAHLTYRAVNDPHYWLGEIHCAMHPGWFIALSYSVGAEQLPDLGLNPHS
jgi:hypothetical protein